MGSKPQPGLMHARLVLCERISSQGLFSQGHVRSESEPNLALVLRRRPEDDNADGVHGVHAGMGHAGVP